MRNQPLLVVSVWLWARALGASSVSVRGAHPEALSLYNESFSCFDGSRTVVLGLRAVNDGHCDCPGDGSDEPGTNACAVGQFHCDSPRLRSIGSSRVSDGVCDWWVT